MIDDHTTGRHRVGAGEDADVGDADLADVDGHVDDLADLDGHVAALADLDGGVPDLADAELDAPDAGALDAEGIAALEMLDDEVEIDLDSIVPLDGGRPAGAGPSSLRPGPWRPGISRRGLLRTAVVGATAVGMTALGVFPPAREALADGYDIDKSGCAGIRYANCKDCCCSTVCFDCCNSKGWHKRTGVYRLRPNQCFAGGGNRNNDGWFWRACSCRKRNGRRGKRTNRCHDGYKIGSAGAVRTICRKRIGCL